MFSTCILRVIQVENFRYKMKFQNSFESKACSQYFTGSGYCDYLCIGNTSCTEQFHCVFLPILGSWPETSISHDPETETNLWKEAVQ